jgi:lipopolysaccharide transport system ATP-binding protein
VSDIAIRVEGLGKRYRIGAKQQAYRTLRETITDLISAPFCLVQRISKSKQPSANSTIIWALKDAFFEVKKGEVIGIIGHNGAGKSTLLKILSRITEPTVGSAKLVGRVSSLLEVGTGFHPELTGRENIYLNGAILGMKRTEIKHKFDEIVSFAEVETFIDTPVKHYSSGMHLRLAFAVAAHLEPEILLVDEVLAVGDAAFQKKCLGKMGNVASEGRTVLLVSHNMGAIGSLCKRSILLEAGHVKKNGLTADVVGDYLSSQAEAPGNEAGVEDDKRSGYLLVRPGKTLNFMCGRSIKFEFEIRCPKPCSEVTAGIVLYDMFENPVVGASSKIQGISGKGESPHWGICCDMGDLPLNSGRYYISVWFGNQYRDYAVFCRVFSIDISPSDPFGWGNNVPSSWGHFFWKPKWNMSPLQGDS